MITCVGIAIRNPGKRFLRKRCPVLRPRRILAATCSPA